MFTPERPPSPRRRLVADDPALDLSLTMVLDRAFASSSCSSRQELFWTAMSVWAPTAILMAIDGLPDRSFHSAEEVRRLLALVE